MDKYLVVLSGQGDTYIKLVSQASWEWINSPPQSSKSAWKETVPDFVPDKYTISDKVSITIGSYENDRAIHCCGQDFDSVVEAMAYAKENGINIAGEYHGYIY